MEPRDTAVRRLARNLLPAGSRRRRWALLWVNAVRAFFTEFSRSRVALDWPRKRNPGMRSYLIWRLQQPRAVIHRVATAATFGVVIESPSGRTIAARRTARSARRNGELHVVTLIVAPGTVLFAAAEAVDTDFLLFVRAGTVLRKGALTVLAREFRRDPARKIIGFDSDHRLPWAWRRKPVFRPEYSPDTLLGSNYLGRSFAIKRSEIGDDARLVLNDTGVWRLLLSARFEPWEVGRCSLVLASEQHPESAESVGDDALMVREVLADRGEDATTTVESGVVRVRFVPRAWPSVSIVIPTRHSRENLARLLPGLAATDYPGDMSVYVIDNGRETRANMKWYRAHERGLDLTVFWWTEQPFNYSRVNNVAIGLTGAEVIVMLNDDTEIVDEQWLAEMVGHVMRPGVGTVGWQLRNDAGRIQHGGVTVGPGGFADNLFAGLEPNSHTLIGPTSWYRNTLAVTGACVAIKRVDLEASGGLDERFTLCGSDVVLGLEQVMNSRRNVVIPFDAVRHFESLTRGTEVPDGDFYASYWRYHPWLQNGDPFTSPNVCRLVAVPRFASRTDRAPLRYALDRIGRASVAPFQSASIATEARALVRKGSASQEVVESVHSTHRANRRFRNIRTVNWFIPDVDMPFFGGLNTAFRLAAKLTREHGVVHRFIVLSAPNELYIASALAAAFPELSESEVLFYDGSDEDLARLPGADAAVATLWLTAVHVAKAPATRRKFYLMQDFEPAFYPASTLFALAEETYRLGLYGICNSPSMGAIYRDDYGGEGKTFVPAVDRTVYNAEARRIKGADEPVTIFAYSRDHFRNCWELVDAALSEIKARHGDRVRIITAGARHLPSHADYIDLGLLDYRDTGRVFRETDIGLTMQISRHPSYLPLELMACGVPMVAPNSPHFSWLFRDGENSLLAMRSVEDIVAKLERLIGDARLRRKLGNNALATIDKAHASWDEAFAGIYAYMQDPEARA